MPKRPGDRKSPDAKGEDAEYLEREPLPDNAENILAQFSPIQQEIIKVAFRYRGLSQSEIARVLGIDRQKINYHFKKKELQEILARLSKDIFGRLDHLRDLATDHYENVLKDPNADPWLKYYMSRDIMSSTLQSKFMAPKAPEIESLLIVDESQRDKKPEQL